MLLYIDQLHRPVEISSQPKRIVSLVPSQTELLYDLGLEEEVVGLTKFCVHPQKWFIEKNRIGGTKNLHLDKIKSLHPDLIIANKEENRKEQVEELAKEFPVWISDVNTLEDAYNMIKSIGEITGTIEKAETLIKHIKANFSQLQTPNTRLQTCYLIWKDPYMTVGSDTFIHHMLAQAGFQNIFADKHRYPEITLEDLLLADCQMLLLSSEPYPFQQKHVEELQVLLPKTKIALVDGEMFSWYGSRLLQSPLYFEKLQQQIGMMM